MLYIITQLHGQPHLNPPLSYDIIHLAIARGHLTPRLTRDFLRKQSDWMDWNNSEFKQLNRYHAQGMFGELTLPP